MPASPLKDVNSVLLADTDAPLLQAFLDQNPAYFIAVQGTPAESDEAEREINDLPPAGYPYDEKYVIGYTNQSGELIAVANMITDLFAPTVWHLATFYLATNRHGTGQAGILYRSLEQWAIAHGARWIRLGVVVGNTRAERFWSRCGFQPVRVRSAVRMGQVERDILVMCKSFYDQKFGDYLALVAHDRETT
ncbi:MAG: GNAT family N-acetyltransferase [Pseudomonadota bacterium]|nr:GNAT family N-acetyltransferase [Pseudomonadota bacterium]